MASRKVKARVADEATYQAILQEHDVTTAQRQKRSDLLHQLSSDTANDGHGPHAVISHLSSSSLDGNDVGMLANMLTSVGDVETLNLILESPGGDGTQVEKFVAICRNQCKKFRVIIPNEAKSAATLIALGADEIVMGPPSELGPIDAQIPAMISGFGRFISAQSFIDSRDKTLKSIDERKKNGEDIDGELQMLSTLDLPFIAECERLMDFGRVVGKNLLAKHMFHGDTDADAKADRIVGELSSVEIQKVHGRWVSGATAKSMGLRVKLLGRSDPFWKQIIEYYQRAHVCFGMIHAVKLFESEHDMFHASAPKGG